MGSSVNPFDAAALESNIPRYTSYPTAPHFCETIGPETYGTWLSALPGGAVLSLYLHVPFCDQLCWFCACRTQGTKTYSPILRYTHRLIDEIRLIGALTGKTHRVSQMHWGGGSPTVLAPEEIAGLKQALNESFPAAEGAEFAVEIDPRDMTEARLDAFAAAGLTRASIGVQDFEPRVQRAIGRNQTRETTRVVIEGLRARGVRSVNVDLLYGLPGQTGESLRRTIEGVIALAPDRIALFGYAHVPWMAKRQKMIDETLLPGTEARKRQMLLARGMLREAGYQPVGIDHFARPEDALSRAAREGTLRRNFQGYTVDHADALIGFGASAIGRLPQGFVQNDHATAGYQNRLAAGALATIRGAALSPEDAARGDAIQQILCSFALDCRVIEAQHGPVARPVREIADRLLAIAPPGALRHQPGGFAIHSDWHAHARPIAAAFDAYLGAAPARHSLAI